jgi:hypothetical protein
MATQAPYSLEGLRLTIDLDDEGTILRWTVTDRLGRVVEEYRLVATDLPPSDMSHSWDIPSAEAYLVIRDMLRFMTEADWEPNTVL